jgi:hypothetical protein
MVSLKLIFSLNHLHIFYHLQLMLIYLLQQYEIMVSVFSMRLQFGEKFNKVTNILLFVWSIQQTYVTFHVN